MTEVLVGDGIDNARLSLRVLDLLTHSGYEARRHFSFTPGWVVCANAPGDVIQTAIITANDLAAMQRFYNEDSPELVARLLAQNPTFYSARGVEVP